MNYERIRVEDTAPVARITLAWPEKRNALSLQMMEEITRAVSAVGQRAEVGSIILSAEGRAFSAGHYLKEMVDRDINHQRRIFDTCVTMMNTLQSLRQPVIAQVQGIATAAGCQLVAACDLAVAANEAVFATPGVKIGLFCTTPMVALSRAVGRKRAMEMLLTGAPIDAATAENWGLINHAVPSEDLEARTIDLATSVADASDYVIAVGKQAFYSQIDMAQDRAYDYAKEVMSMNAMALDAQEGMTAFLEKRAPLWVGK